MMMACRYLRMGLEAVTSWRPLKGVLAFSASEGNYRTRSSSEREWRPNFLNGELINRGEGEFADKMT
jgi:hypothetical protein